MLKVFLVFLFYFQILPQKAKADPVITNVTNPVVHAEGPVWDDENQLLYFVNTFNASVFRYNPMSGKEDTFVVPHHNSIGIILPKKSSPFKFVIAADRQLYDFTWKPNHAHGTLSKRMGIEKDKPKNQVNDGKADSNGHIWMGTLERNEDLTVNNNRGSLYRVKMPEYKLEEKVKNLSISNGLAFSGDNKYLFHIDSANKEIYRYSIHINTAEMSKRRVLFSLATHNIEGIPDGMTIDTEDNLWVAVFKGWKILKINGHTGELMQTIQMPVQYVTSCTFGGPDLDILYVTTSKLHVTEEELPEQPLAGAVFQIKGLGVKGRPCSRVAD